MGSGPYDGDEMVDRWRGLTGATVARRLADLVASIFSRFDVHAAEFDPYREELVGERSVFAREVRRALRVSRAGNIAPGSDGPRCSAKIGKSIGSRGTTLFPAVLSSS